MDVTTGRVRADTLQRPHTAALTMALPSVQDNGVALYPQTLHHQHHHQQNHRRRRLFGCGDEDNNNNNNSNNNYGGSDRSPTYIDNTTLLVDELEGLRSDNFQLRLRVYNAEQRVDELTAAADEATWCCRRCGGRSRAASFSADSDAGASETGSSVDNDGESSSSATAAAEKAAAMASMAKSAVRTISDLMTVNQRLIALLNAVLSAKPVSKSDEDDRRWQTLRNQIKQYCNVSSLALQGEGLRPHFDEEDYEYDEDDEETDSEDENTEPIIVEEREATIPAATTAGNTITITTTTTGTNTIAAATSTTSTAVMTNDDDYGGGGGGGANDELVRLRARCQHLELSIQQLVNTELWARNRQIGRLEQQRCAQQQQQRQRRNDVATSTPPQRSRPAAASTPVAAPKGILVQRSCRPQTLDARPEARANGPTMKSPPPVLPDYSEVNFFFSCDEEDDLLLQRPDAESDVNTAPSSSLSSSMSDGSTGSDDEDEKPANGIDRPRRRQSFRRGGYTRHKHLNSAVKATESAPAPTPAPVAVADAQVQCDHVQNADDRAQVQQLRRELDARRRENSRLYEMLLKLQRNKETGKSPSPESSSSSPPPPPQQPPPSRDTGSSSPEPYGRAARDVRSRIADLLPPLLMRTTGSATACSPPRDCDAADGDGRPQQQQQQQMNVLNRLRDRIVEYERQVLLGEEDAATTPAAAAAPEPEADSDAENAEVRRMDRAALVNVALPRVVDRFRRVLQVQQQQQQQQQQQRPAYEVQDPEPAVPETSEPRECNLRRRRTPNRTLER